MSCAVAGRDLAYLQGQASIKAMSAAEMAEYEEKKLKMRKAMGENLHDDVTGKSVLPNSPHLLTCSSSVSSATPGVLGWPLQAVVHLLTGLRPHSPVSSQTALH